MGGPGGMRGGRGMGLVGMVHRPDVAADLGVTAAQLKKIDGFKEAPRPQGRPTPEQMEQRQLAEKRQLATVLSGKQLARLEQIQIQIQKERALLNPGVQAKLKITGAQKAKLLAISDKYRGQMMAAFQKGGNDRSKMMAQMQKMNASQGAELKAVLTKGQLAMFRTLGGKPFKSTFTPGGPGGFGGPGGPGGPGRPGGRPPRG